MNYIFVYMKGFLRVQCIMLSNLDISEVFWWHIVKDGIFLNFVY